MHIGVRRETKGGGGSPVSRWGWKRSFVAKNGADGALDGGQNKQAGGVKLLAGTDIVPIRIEGDRNIGQVDFLQREDGMEGIDLTAICSCWEKCFRPK